MIRALSQLAAMETTELNWRFVGQKERASERERERERGREREKITCITWLIYLICETDDYYYFHLFIN